MLFQTTQAHEELRAKIRAFAEEEVKPIAFSLDQANEFPAEAVKKLGEMGLMGIPYPKEYGGAGLDAISYAIAVEELSRVDGGTGVILSAHGYLGSWPIFAFGTEEQKQKYLVPLARGEKIGAFGLTEPNAGGAWDNATKYMEGGHHGGKGSECHKAAVIGDTVGDPFKDTSGPSLNILIKLCSTVSIVFSGLITTVHLF